MLLYYCFPRQYRRFSVKSGVWFLSAATYYVVLRIGVLVSTAEIAKIVEILEEQGESTTYPMYVPIQEATKGATT
jgi:hypothetical protein